MAARSPSSARPRTAPLSTMEFQVSSLAAARKHVERARVARFAQRRQRCGAHEVRAVLLRDGDQRAGRLGIAKVAQRFGGRAHDLGMLVRERTDQQRRGPRRARRADRGCGFRENAPKLVAFERCRNCATGGLAAICGKLARGANARDDVGIPREHGGGKIDAEPIRTSASTNDPGSKRTSFGSKSSATAMVSWARSTCARIRRSSPDCPASNATLDVELERQGLAASIACF